VKCKLCGMPARIIREMKNAGSALSIREILVQALFALEEKNLEREIRLEHKEALRRERLEPGRDKEFDE